MTLAFRTGPLRSVLCARISLAFKTEAAWPGVERPRACLSVSNRAQGRGDPWDFLATCQDTQAGWRAGMYPIRSRPHEKGP